MPSSFGIVPPAGGANATAPPFDTTIANIGPVVSGPTVAGLDGNSRIVYDVLNPGGTGIVSTNLWVVGPNGNLLLAISGIPLAGPGGFPLPTGFPVPPSVAVPPGAPTAAGVFLLTPLLCQGQANGNTTLAFLLPSSPIPAGVTSANVLNTWTFNSAGNLIAATSAGPYTVTVGGVSIPFQIEDADWDQSTGKLVVKWATTSAVGSRAYSVWVLNQFGAIQTSFGPIGFAGAILQKALLLKNGNLHLVWDIPTPAAPPLTATATHTTALWVVNSAGQLTVAGASGPY
jgi:hypothetical protein